MNTAELRARYQVPDDTRDSDVHAYCYGYLAASVRCFLDTGDRTVLEGLVDE